VRFAWKNELAPALLIMLLIVSWGATRTMKPTPASDRNLRLALVQPSIPQTLIFDAAESTNRFRQIMQLSRAALETRPDVLIWPEASLPASLSQEFFDEVMEMITTHSTPIIFGGLDWEETTDENGDRTYRPYNSAFYFDDSGRHRGTYRKQRLVIFGEYTPFARWIPFLAKIFPAGVGFGSGTLPEPFVAGPQEATMAVNICFEDNFADVLRNQVKPETDFVLNLTNNGWFSESAAQWQHAANAIFRAVENRVSLVRCTNNGLTCWIDEQGRLREIFRDEHGSVYGRGFLTLSLPLLPSNTARRPTLYHQFGDWFGWSCSAVVVLAWFRNRFGKHPATRKDGPPAD
jgi:apolipoprotein N-acyltransferase